MKARQYSCMSLHLHYYTIDSLARTKFRDCLMKVKKD
jgi:hypothetical protein